MMEKKPVTIEKKPVTIEKKLITMEKKLIIMEEKEVGDLRYPEERKGQGFIYGEDEESCYYFDRECVEKKKEEKSGSYRYSPRGKWKAYGR